MWYIALLIYLNSVEVFMETIINITQKATDQIQKIYKEHQNKDGIGLRVGVVGGGCSGLSYKIDFDQPKENDNLFDCGELKILIDPKSSIYLKDVILDFEDGLNGKGFIFKNPNASNTCGCGESFSV